ncbi:hypothetical protein [Flammeovirga aprica]|nr:hypothetical protein [Flammeovirga aprica]
MKIWVLDVELKLGYGYLMVLDMAFEVVREPQGIVALQEVVAF